ncbi:hypothetical protein [Cellulosimicrobium sp. SL-1]|uniref:hypothetical protein n=1 Tax=Cellulosimicrobium sp. SL-1 TaxID=2699423 RepID=UPI0013D2901F|nr:hypothetical protein [Cellulosimicrobium sp. SL-1]
MAADEGDHIPGGADMVLQKSLRKSWASIGAAGVLVLGGLVALPPTATAATGTITVRASTATCQYKALKPSGGATAQNSSCYRVSARVQYRSAGGTAYWTNRQVSTSNVTVYVPSGTTYASGRTGGSIMSGSAELGFYEQTV